MVSHKNMSKSFSYISRFALIFALVFVVGGYMLPKTSNAQLRCPEGWILVGGKCVENPAAATEQTREGLGSGSGGSGLSQWGMNKIVIPVSFAILKFMALQTALGGKILNGVIFYTVGQMSANYKDLTAISDAWEAIRDLANMTFIFILLYAAIQTILGIGRDVKKLIVNVIIVAILINFSLFFTQVVIDASNILAILFYDAIAPGALAVADVGKALSTPGISDAFMNLMGLQSLYDIRAMGQIPDGTLTIALMGSIMLLIAAVVFIAAAIMFIVRYALLIMILILSPLALMGFILPGIKTYADKWKDSLIGQAIFAPVYFMLIWISLRVLGSIGESIRGFAAGAYDPKSALSGLAGNASTEGVAGAALKFNQEPFAMFINFIIVIVFLIASLVIARALSEKAVGAAKMNKWGFNKALALNVGLVKAEAAILKPVARMAAYYPKRGIAKLDEKFGETKFAHSPIGSAIRGGTTEALAKVKIAGSTALETKKSFEQGRETREKITQEKTAAKKARETKALLTKKDVTKEEIETAESDTQRAMMHLSPKSFTEIAKHRFFDPEFMRHASTAQFLALMAGSRLTEDEKKKAIDARFKYMADSLKDYEIQKKEYDKKYEEWQKTVANPLKLTAADKDGLTALGPAPKMSAYGDVRNKSAKEWELLNQHDSFELLKKKDFVSVIRSDIISTMRAGDNLTHLEKDELRENKYAPMIDAAENVDRLEKDLANQELDLTVRVKAIKALQWANYDMDKAMLGKSPGEIAGAPKSKGWKKSAVIRRMDSAILPEFAKKDAEDKKWITDQFIKDLKAQAAGGPEFSAPNRKAIQWMLNTVNGRNFFPEANDEIKRLATDLGIIEKGGGKKSKGAPESDEDSFIS